MELSLCIPRCPDAASDHYVMTRQMLVEALATPDWALKDECLKRSSKASAAEAEKPKTAVLRLIPLVLIAMSHELLYNVYEAKVSDSAGGGDRLRNRDSAQLVGETGISAAAQIARATSTKVFLYYVMSAQSERSVCVEYKQYCTSISIYVKKESPNLRLTDKSIVWIFRLSHSLAGKMWSTPHRTTIVPKRNTIGQA